MSVNLRRDLRLHVRVAWARESLDRRLAEGADPATEPLLDARAARILAPSSRASLAAGLERVVATADEPPARLSAAVPVRRSAVRGARDELLRLAGELRHMRDPRAEGVAMAEQLLTDGASPLYTAATPDEVARAAREAADALRAPGHRFCMPTVVPLSSRPFVESLDW
jgi:hypothetical protein